MKMIIIIIIMAHWWKPSHLQYYEQSIGGDKNPVLRYF